MADFSLTALPWKAQLAVFVVLSLAGAGAFYYFYEMPAEVRIAASETELGSIRARIDKGLATARQLPEFRKEVAELQARLDSLKPILPEEKDAADLLRRVNTLAVQSNLTVQVFRPQAIATRQMHAEWPITLELEGTYHNLGVFLDRISKFPRIINVGALDIRGKAQPTANATIDVTCTATTFVLLDTPAAAPPKKAE
ncbi:MAG TPA: type 4a pilus biogenesis protein PilO [Vicinamibacterales bacterium]|nr:type 4a pilus biogenesis protein PilO [Vicinamibacterales bacterium]